MKNKIKQTTVWQIEVSLQNSRVVNNKFNFALLDNFYVTNINLFIEKIIKKYKINIYKLSKEIKLNKIYIFKKIRYKEAIPVFIIKKVLNKINYKYKDEDLINLFIANKSQFYYFKNGGPSKTVRLPYYVDEISDIIQFLRPDNKKNKVHLLTRKTKLIKKIINFFSVEESKRKDGRYEINSITLNKFLKYFFKYDKKPLLSFPLSNIDFKKIDLVRGVVLPLLLTDGNVYKNKYSYYFDFGSVSKNKKLHDIFADSLYFTLKKYPSQYFLLKKDDFRKTSFIPNIKKAKEILEICNTTKTGPAKNQNKEDFLKEIQPSIDFLTKCDIETKKMALRLWFCTEGSISLNRGKQNNTIRARLNLACAHPTLLRQLRSLLSGFGIKMNVAKGDCTWSGHAGLDTTKRSSILNFLKIGGFLPKVYIQNSEYHRGFEKQKVLLAIFEYVEREKKGTYNRDIPIKRVHKEINNIVEKKRFKNPQYYISKHSII